MPSFEQVIIVRGKTRLELLIERFNTKAQAKFYIERSGLDFTVFEKEHDSFYFSFENLLQLITDFKKYKILDRSYLPNYIFTKSDIIFVIGQDGLVANTAKYVNGQPIVAINPDENSYDGILLPFNLKKLTSSIQKIQSGKFKTVSATMAKAKFSDGQTLLAFNDFFLGPKSHTSARYNLKYKGESESQSSSGIIISTGAGSTGWMSSVFNMVKAVSAQVGGSNFHYIEQKWNAENLIFAVREPFKSKTSSASIVFGEIDSNSVLQIESLMPDNGIVFSDGIEADSVKFNSGTTVKFMVANEKANLVLH